MPADSSPGGHSDNSGAGSTPPSRMQTIVIGHRNPDMDSICSAIAYAELKRQQGDEGVVAARAGATNERIDYVLERFGFEAPLLVTDLSPRVGDVMQSRVFSVPVEAPIYDAIQLIEQRRLRGLPVVDGGRKCLGLLSALKITAHLFPSRQEAATARVVTASLADIVTTFGGKAVTGELATSEEEHFFVVGAMDRGSFAERMTKYAGRRVVVFVGDRPYIQEHAIEAGVEAIVVTGEMPIAEEICAAARAAGVTLISSPHDTATTVLLARGAVRVGRVLDTEFTSFRRDTLLDEARRVAADSPGFVFPITNEKDELIGILSKSDFLKTIPRQLILVDHNELGQAVHGADRVPIVEVLDHHKLGGFASNTPILFWNNPVGSTSTIVAMCYRQAGIAIPGSIAGLLLAGLISDTLNLTSPTATPVDAEIARELSALAGVDATKLAEEIFSVGSPLLTMAPEQAVSADSKLYEEAGRRFTVAQIEELTFAHFEEKRESLLEALEAHRQREALFFAALLVTDINTQTSLLLVRGAESFLATIDYPRRGPHLWELAGVVSRKKQLLPYLLHCLPRVNQPS